MVGFEIRTTRQEGVNFSHFQEDGDGEEVGGERSEKGREEGGREKNKTCGGRI